MNLKHFRVFLISFISCFLTNIYAQNLEDSLDVDRGSIMLIERYVLNSQLDSAKYLLPKSIQSPYLKVLDKLIHKKEVALSEYSMFIDSLKTNSNISFLKISNFINKHVHVPSKSLGISIEYVKLKVYQISDLSELTFMDEAIRIQKELDDYINSFEESQEDVIKAKVYASTNQIVLYIIQKEIEKGKALVNKNLEIANRLHDDELKIFSLFYLCDFLIFENKLDEFILSCEKSLEIENNLEKKSKYYIGTLIHIIDAYIYKGGYDNRVQELLTELFYSDNGKIQSFSLYAKYLGTLSEGSEDFNSILKQFNVSNLIEFSETTSKIAEPKLNANEFFHLQREISKTFQVHNYLKKAIEYKDSNIDLIQQIYSLDLANSLASNKIQQVVKEKNLIIKYQEDQKKYYIAIVILIGMTFVLLLVAFFITKKHSIELEEKNSIINKALKEKDLLFQEVHHRVKNNFQIVSSLLELQAKEIQDQDAKRIVSDGQNRVKSMSLVHQKLYQNKDGLINFEEYLKHLINELNSLYSSGNNVKTYVNAKNIKFDVDTAIPLGLIVNELITNSYKHAFKDVENGELKISLQQIDNNMFKLVVKDNGKTIDSNINIKDVKSFGLRLVTRLVKQLHGNIEINTLNGTSFVIVFKDKLAREKID